MEEFNRAVPTLSQPQQESVSHDLGNKKHPRVVFIGSSRLHSMVDCRTRTSSRVFITAVLPHFDAKNLVNYWSTAGPWSRPAVKASGTVGSYKSQVRGGSKLSCQRAPELIHPYIDEELDRLQASEFRQHLDQCKDCNLFYRNQLALRFALRQNSLYYHAPHDLLRQVRSALRKEVDPEMTVGPAAQTLSPGTATKRH